MALPYKTKYEIELAVASYLMSKGLSVQEGTASKVIADAIAGATSAVYEDIQELGNIFSIYRATGPDLDDVAALYALTRRQKTIAYDFGENVQIKIDDRYGFTTAGEMLQFFNESRPVDMRIYEVVIPSGTTLYDYSKTIKFKTIEQVSIGNTQTYTYCKVVGANSYAVETHTLKLIDKFNNNELYRYLVVDNVEPIKGGQEDEDDETFRYRVINAIYTAASSNYKSIEDACLMLPSVSSVNITNNKYGIGTFEVMVNSINAITTKQEISITQAQVDATAAMGTLPIVVSPVYTGVYMKIKLKFDKNEADRGDYTALAREAVKNYINNLRPGEALYLENVTRIIRSVSSSILSVRYEQLGIGEYNPDLSNEIINIRPVGTGDLIANPDEKFVSGNAVLEVSC